MIPLLLLLLTLFPNSAAASDTGLVCAIDMGSNSLKLILGEMKGGAYIQHYVTKNRLAVGDDMSQTGVISRPKLKKIRKTLKKYLSVCDSRNIQTRSAVATAAFREAKNQREVIKIAKALGLPMEIASEERESELAHLVATMGQRDVAVIDNGSRTIELVVRDGSRYQWSVFNLGFRIAFQQFFQPARTFAEADDKYRRELAPHLLAARFMKNRPGYAGVEMEGVARFLLSTDHVDEARISLDAVSKKIASLRAMTEDAFSRMKTQKEIDEILPRLVVLEQTLMTFGYRDIEVFERELGVGLIVERSIQGGSAR